MTPKQKANLDRGSKIRSLCMMYAVARSLYYDKVLLLREMESINEDVDNALVRIRGESETAKRKREREELVR